MQIFKDEAEVKEYCEALELETNGESRDEAIERIKIIEMNIRNEARHELEIPKMDDGILLKDTCETIMSIVNFTERDVISIYKDLSKYVLGHTKTFLEYHPVLRRISMLVKSMQRLYNKYISEPLRV